MHHIRKHILRTLTYTKWARFRDMRPERTDSNLYNYHLKELIKDGYIEQNRDKGYRLSPMGLRFVDHVSLESFDPRWQPKILTMLVAQNNAGEILMWPKLKQPFIGNWALPSGKVHYDDISSLAAIEREISYFYAKKARHISRVGVVEFRAYINKDLVTNTLAHIFTAKIIDKNILTDRVQWVDIKKNTATKMSPATREIIEKTMSSSELFFASYDIDW